ARPNDREARSQLAHTRNALDGARKIIAATSHCPSKPQRYSGSAVQLQAYFPAGIAILCALGFSGLFTALAVLVGPKATNPDKLKPFECGSEPIGSPRGRYSVKFYQVAILFLVFDI